MGMPAKLPSVLFRALVILGNCALALLVTLGMLVSDPPASLSAKVKVIGGLSSEMEIFAASEDK